MRRRFAVLLILLTPLPILMGAAPALAVLPSERLDDPVLEARARGLSHELRCLVCRNETIDDSNADLAHDLRVLVRERLKAGDSDAAVLQFVTSRYGDYVLLRPPVKPETWALWFGPAGLAVLGAFGAAFHLRRRRLQGEAPAPLTEAEKTRLAELLDDSAK